MSETATPNLDESDVDIKVMKELVTLAAEATARKVSAEIKAELKTDMAAYKADIIKAVREENHAYHGDMTPAQHAISHDRMNKFLEWMENMNKSFWGQIVAGLVKWAFVVLLIGYFLWNQAGDQISKVTTGS